MKKLLLTAALFAAAASPAFATEAPAVAAQCTMAGGPPPCAAPAPGPMHPGAGGGLLGALFGPGPLVNTQIALGVQTNAQAGAGNGAVNILDLGQLGAAPAAGGGLANTQLGFGVQTNAQTGFENAALNGFGAAQGLVPVR